MRMTPELAALAVVTAYDFGATDTPLLVGSSIKTKRHRVSLCETYREEGRRKYDEAASQ